MNKMKERSTYLTILSSCVLSVWALSSFAAEMSDRQNALTKQQEEGIRKRLEEDRDKFEKLLPVTIYGKVIDQDGKPVPEADVCISWQRATLLIGKADYGQKGWVKTDVNGCFLFTCVKPYRAFADAQKDGYAQFSSSIPDNLIWKKTSKDTPVVITLRKKGETTFLVKGEDYDTIRVFAPNSQTNSVDVLWNRGEGKKRRHLYSDFTVSAENVIGSNIWSVTYTATDATGGIILTNELLYMAPADGYQRKVMLNGPPWPTYMYLRSRSPVIYSRILLKHDTWRELNKGEGFRMSCESWVNPYGERNIEYDNRLDENWYIKEYLKSEAKAAIQANRLPTKPDISQRIKEMNEKPENENADKSRSSP